MILNRRLLLDAYSFSSIELNAVINVLEKSSARLRSETLPLDSGKHFGVRFELRGSEIARFENRLKIRFIGRLDKTRIEMSETQDGQSFKCARIDTPPAGCETIFADDDVDAMVKCSLVAANNGWIGAVPTPGSCSRQA
jgi:hypothetical protein